MTIFNVHGQVDNNVNGPLGNPVRIDTLTKVSYIHVEWHSVSIEGLSNVTFTIMAANDAHVALSQYPDDLHTYTYELVIGGWKNKKSVNIMHVHREIQNICMVKYNAYT